MVTKITAESEIRISTLRPGHRLPNHSQQIQKKTNELKLQNQHIEHGDQKTPKEKKRNLDPPTVIWHERL